jgi:ATPase subunit of ABC transporter with duplicated ATPase domains
MLGNFTGTAMAHPDTERRNSITNNNSNAFGTDSDASTITANADGTRSRGNTDGDTKDHPPAASADNLAGNGSEVETDSMERREEEVHQLARRYTTQSHYSTTGQNVFNATPGSALDPNGENFNARAWCKAMLHMQHEDEQAHPPRTAGLAFRDLNVFGFGSPTDYQKSFGNVWLEGIGLAKRLAGKGGKTRIDILRNLEGYVESGEMLVVLGPPGSGCSTFLKTVTGETHGFFVDENSKLNYQGEFCLACLRLACANRVYRYQR